MRKIISIAGLAFIGGSIRGCWTLLAGDSHYLATMIINLTGAFLLAFLAQTIGRLGKVSEYLWTGISTGLVGGYTTFSTFSWDSVNLFMHHSIGLGFLYMLGSLIGGIIFAQLGTTLGDYLYKKVVIK